ncbi:MAG TPA: GNAT family N-acetyltransferase [Blastocatellia bacterium]|nr:GNAT family N-acetyltransferase [Blastocatellia bacterium]
MGEPGTRVEVTRTYLQMGAPEELRSAHLADERVRVERVRVERAINCPASFFRYLYAEVGRPYHWTDRLAWTDGDLRARLSDPRVSLWLMLVEGSPAGYFELEKHGDGSVEIAYFGLLGEFFGRGLGKHLLTVAAESAWAEGATRVWLHTCTLDGPAAMPNYLSRGFKPFKQEKYFTEISDRGRGGGQET